MVSFLVQVAIGDYAKWRPVFDKNRRLREKAGLLKERVYRNADNPKEVVVWGETSDPAKVSEALKGPDIQAAMKEAGVVGPPKVHVMD